MTAKKPAFKRQDFKIKRLKNKWRKPRGMHSKQRRKFKGNPREPNIGYGTPRETRGLHPSGLEPILVNNLNDLNNLNEKQGIILSSTLGKKKKVEILKKAKELKILNLKDPEKYIKKVQEELKNKKEEIKKKQEKKEKAKKESEKKTKEKKEEKTEEQKEKETKEEKRKVLEKKATKESTS